MENTYEYDEFLTTYLTSLKRDFILRLYLNIFSNIDKLNNTTFFKEDQVIELDILELEIREIITKHEEGSNDDIINLIINKIVSYVVKELYKHSISLNTDIKLSDLDKVLETLVTILNIDPSLAQTVIEELNSELVDDVTMAFINIVVDYTDLTLTQAVEVVEHVGFDFKETLIDYLEKKKMMRADNSEYNYIVKLINLDSDYGKTHIIKDFIKDGYEDTSIEYNLDDMYNNISKYKSNSNLIAHEIAAVLFLSSDTRNSLSDSLEKYINFESLGYTGIYLNEIKTVIEKLIGELEIRL